MENKKEYTIEEIIEKYGDNFSCKDIDTLIQTQNIKPSEIIKLLELKNKNCVIYEGGRIKT